MSDVHHKTRKQVTWLVAGFLLEMEELEGVAVAGLQQLLHWLPSNPRDHLCHKVHVVGD
jgi:hypothetical protein